MDRSELDCFLVLAEELHFGRTADRLRLSRARVSQLVQRMERRVGAPLFTRTSRHVALTELGARLREELAPHVRGVDEALARAAASARGAQGRLSVGFSTPLAGELAMRAAERLREPHPGLTVQVCEVPLTDPYGMLRRGEYDLQLTDFPVREDDVVRGPTLLAEGRVLAVAAGHPLAGRPAVSLDELALAGVPLLSVEGDLPGYWLEHRRPARAPGGREIARGSAVTSLQEALTLVAAGREALLTAAHTADYQGRPGVAFVPVTGLPPLGYALMWRSGAASGATELYGVAATAAAGELGRAGALERAGELERAGRPERAGGGAGAARVPSGRRGDAGSPRGTRAG
ncbi:LysR family transcriptional regulator [Streptomyces sp. NPDC003717]|uniref:LysR family transcriptional regulator n=1 Tax=Streptomyces sp. NPDC003717 TaxID=3154276 RepID=UPI0033A73DB9